MSRGWERVRQQVRCAYGCEIEHAAWAWFGKYPMILCEPCAGKYQIHRPDLSSFTSVSELARRYAEKSR
jgi:hypothetical protein